jgi:hypothetical protein
MTANGIPLAGNRGKLISASTDEAGTEQDKKTTSERKHTMTPTKATHTPGPSKATLKKALRNATHCTLQHDGWTCGSCFFAISNKLTNADWQSVLLKRGDYARDMLDNLPKDIGASLRKTLKLAQARE